MFVKVSGKEDHLAMLVAKKITGIYHVNVEKHANERFILAGKPRTRHHNPNRVSVAKQERLYNVLQYFLKR